MQSSEELLHASKDAVGDKVLAVRERLTDALDYARRSCRHLEEKALDGAKTAAEKDTKWQLIHPREGADGYYQ